VFVSLRSVLDAYYTAPRNTFNLFWSLVVQGGMSVAYLLAPSLITAALLVLVPLAILVLLTWRDVHWVRVDLRARERSGRGSLHVLELGASPQTPLLGPDTRWTVAGTIDPKAGLWRTLRSVRAAEHLHRPDLVLVRGSGRLAWAALLVARRPLVLLVPEGHMSGGVRSAAWAVAMVVFPTQAAADAARMQGRSVRIIPNGLEGDAELLRSLRALHDPPPSV
jgi:hypothetical protein